MLPCSTKYGCTLRLIVSSTSGSAAWTSSRTWRQIACSQSGSASMYWSTRGSRSYEALVMTEVVRGTTVSRKRFVLRPQGVSSLGGACHVVERGPGGLVDDILDRDDSVSGLAEDLHVVVGRRGEHGHARVARLASAAASRIVRIPAPMAPEWAPEPTTNSVGHSRAAKSGASSPLTASISITTSAVSAGDMRAERPSAAGMRMIHPSRRNCARTLACPPR